MDNLTPEQRKKNMQNIKNKDTKPEIILRKMLWSKGIRYRKNIKNVLGKPDICIKKYKLAIFCDSDFWHGRLYKENKSIPKINQGYWIPKLERNIARDTYVSDELLKQGWTVFRFLESDIKKNAGYCVEQILEYLKAYTASGD